MIVCFKRYALFAEWYTYSVKYYLNGGRNERGVLSGEASLALYKQLGIKRVLFIVYALVEEYWQDSWSKSESLIKINGLESRSLTIHNSDPATISSAIRWADFVYMPGGSQGTLLRRMHELGTVQILNQITQENNIKLLGGGSAGAMVMGTWCIVGYKNVKNIKEGLRYLPGYIIDSHFTERNRLPRLQSVLRDLGDAHMIGMGLDEDTAVLLDENFKITAINGPGNVTIIDEKVSIYDTNSPFTV